MDHPLNIFMGTVVKSYLNLPALGLREAHRSVYSTFQPLHLPCRRPAAVRLSVGTLGWCIACSSDFNRVIFKAGYMRC
jgi:hypothetical protein